MVIRSIVYKIKCWNMLDNVFGKAMVYSLKAPSSPLLLLCIRSFNSHDLVKISVLKVSSGYMRVLRGVNLVEMFGCAC